jgi:cytoskeletal protein CcmA (bactofilin family)
VEGDIRYGSIAVEHGACLLGLLLKLEEDSVVQDPQPQVDALIQKAQKPAATSAE